jgi:hypothetical protein
VRNLKTIPTFLCLLFCKYSFSQDQDKSTTISLFAGTINYQGDMNPNSFTFRHSNFATGLAIRKPLNRWVSLRAGVNMGKIEAADRYNRDYLKPRNLSFYTNIKEAYAGLEFTMLDMSTKHFTPYMYGGFAVFHFNPWTYDNNSVKTYLHPLSTEGEGLSQFPKQRPYKLTDIALAFGGGARFAISDCINICIDFSQRKTFTDYLDDLSSMYVDRNTLLQAKGPKAVELAYRGDELPGGQPYPGHGEQRGTPSEMDWYYFFGATVEVKLNCVSSLLGSFSRNNNIVSQRCPRNVSY